MKCKTCGSNKGFINKKLSDMLGVVYINCSECFVPVVIVSGNVIVKKSTIDLIEEIHTN